MAVTVSKLLDEHIWIRPHECVSLARAIWEALPNDEALTELFESLAKPTEILHRLSIDDSGLLTLTADATSRDRQRRTARGHRWAPPPTDVVKLIGRTIERLLPVPDAPPSYRVPERLRLIVQRAAQPLPRPDATDADQQDELKPFRSVEEFLGVLRPFEAGSGRAALADLYGRWQACHALRLATADGDTPQVFDRVRRVRETVGVSLGEIAARSKIAIELLQEFERGELRNWPRGLFGRQYVREYAREAGLDPAGLLRLVEAQLTPDETIDFIRHTWKSAAQAGRPPTFHDPATEGGRYYPEPTIEGSPTTAAPQVSAAPAKTVADTPGLGLSPRSVFSTARADRRDNDDNADNAHTAEPDAEAHRPNRATLGRVATFMFLIFIAAAFVTLLLLQ